MIADDMVKALIKEFWCFDTYTECGQEFADRMAVKNALKHCYMVLDSDPTREHMEHDYKQNKLGVDEDFWQDVKVRLENLLEKIKN
jgi:hypothetical protein